MKVLLILAAVLVAIARAAPAPEQHSVEDELDHLKHLVHRPGSPPKQRPQPSAPEPAGPEVERRNPAPYGKQWNTREQLPRDEAAAYSVQDLLRRGLIDRQEFLPPQRQPVLELRDEATLEEIIYQLARDMFTQNLLRGEPSPEETFQRLAAFLETEVAFRRISRDMETKIMGIVTGALVDTLRDFPELLPDQPPRKRAAPSSAPEAPPSPKPRPKAGVSKTNSTTATTA